MSNIEAEPRPAWQSSRHVRFRVREAPPQRLWPFDHEPGYYPLGKLWLYGNTRLLNAEMICIERAFGPPTHSAKELNAIEAEAEELVLGGKVLVCAIHSPAHQRAAVVPLRWGAPRILVLSGGFRYHLGEDLLTEPFRTARLWRYQFDKCTDLVVSRRAPDKLPTYARHNPTLDRLMVMLAQRRWPGIAAPFDSITPGINRMR